MMVSGSVDAFSDSDKASLQAKVATTAGVDKSLVVISVAAASVRVTAMITVPASTTPFAVNITLTSHLGTVAAASTALAVALEEVPIITIVYDGIPIMYNGIPNPPLEIEGFVADGPERTSDSSPNMVLIGTLVGAGVVVSFVLLLVGWGSRVMQRSREQRSGQQTEIDIKEIDIEDPTDRTLRT